MLVFTRWLYGCTVNMICCLMAWDKHTLGVKKYLPALPCSRFRAGHANRIKYSLVVYTNDFISVSGIVIIYDDGQCHFVSKAPFSVVTMFVGHKFSALQSMFSEGRFSTSLRSYSSSFPQKLTTNFQAL